MTLTEILKEELEQEAQTTRKMLERVPEDKYEWRPHPKSMTLHQLAGHVAEIPGWLDSVVNKEELNFAQTEYTPPGYKNKEELLSFFEGKLNTGRQALNGATDAKLEEKWVMRTGDQIHLNAPKREMVRHTFCQVVHHRAQLGVYLRLLDVPIPGSYGPSADDKSF